MTETQIPRSLETGIPRPEQGPQSPERNAAPERVPMESAPEAHVPIQTSAPVVPAPVSPRTPTAPSIQAQVESILAEGLEETYRKLDPQTQQIFRQAGEDTSAKIAVLLDSAKVQVKKIVELIVAWLKIIPGVNAFFLEQEAKIRADKVLGLKRPPQV